MFNVFAPGAMNDPYSSYARLRDEDPVSRSDGYWIVSRYSDVLSCLRDHARFSSEQGTGVDFGSNPNLINIDPPDHTRLRRLVQRAFVPGRVAALEPVIDELMDEMFMPLIGEADIELISRFGAPFPVAVIARMMGVPRSHQGDFKRWADLAMDGLAGRVTPGHQGAIEAGRREMVDFFREIVSDRRRRADPGDDLIGVLLSASDDEVLSPPEVIAFCCLLLVAGSETTTNLMAATCLAIRAFPSEWTKAVDDPSLRQSFLQEMLRYDAPVQGFFRTTSQPVEIAGVLVGTNEKVLLSFGSANRDPRKWNDPDRVDIERRPTDHLAFGNGAHHCLGAALAQVEGHAFIRRLAEFAPSVQAHGEPVRTSNPLLRGVHDLHVTLL